jgi:hypothetical protein
MALNFPTGVPAGTLFPVPALADGTQFRFDGTKWLRPSGPGIMISPTAPPDPVVNQCWLDTTSNANLLKAWNGSAWVVVNPNNPLTNWTFINAQLIGDTSGLPPPPGAIGEWRDAAGGTMSWQGVDAQAVTLTLSAGEWLIAGQVAFWAGSTDRTGTTILGHWTGQYDPIPGAVTGVDVPWCGIENMNETGRLSFALPTTRARGTTNFNVGIHLTIWRWVPQTVAWWCYISAQRFR